MDSKNYDFSGWASKYDLPCSDGRTIRKGAFKDMDGMTVPLVWGHDHSSPLSVLGSALIEHRDDGPYIYGSFNDSPEGQHAKEAVQHQDVKYLSIYANRLKEQAHNVMHGVIREVSLVYGGANPGAFIDHAVLAHGDGTYEELADEAVMSIGGVIEHADSDSDSDSSDEGKESKDVADEKKEEKKEEKKDDDRTIQDVFDEMTEEQQGVCLWMMEQAVKNAKDGGSEGSDNDDDDDEPKVKHSDEGDNKSMKYNAFEDNTNGRRPGVISHADQEGILELAKDSRCGSFKNALKSYVEDNYLEHDDTAESVAGFDNTDLIDNVYTSFTAILPEYKEVRPGAPELVTDDQGWISTVMNKVHKSPISRIRTSQVDIRRASSVAAGIRAKGYKKGAKKTNIGNIKLARRTTDPQTIYIKNALHRDDIIDITDFDYVQYLYNIDRMMFNEELATAIMIGDGRDDADADKIDPAHIRPIWTDDDLYTIHYDMTDEKSNIQGSNTTGYFGENYVEAEAMVNACVYSRENYRGSGTPDMFIHPHKLNVMLLARDRNGRRIYSSKAELATTLNVGNIYTVDKFENLTRTVTTNDGNKTMQLNALIVNLADYSLGSTKGGQVTHFTQFDIDFNQQKSLLEGRQSGALTRIYSAIAIEEEVTGNSTTTTGGETGGNTTPSTDPETT